MVRVIGISDLDRGVLQDRGEASDWFGKPDPRDETIVLEPRVDLYRVETATLSNTKPVKFV